MNNFFIETLLFISSFLGVQSIPEVPSYWKVDQPWSQQGSNYHFSASSDKLWTLCSEKPEGFIELPQIVHGVHKVYVNNILKVSTGDETFKKAGAFYNRGALSCKDLPKDANVKWEAFSYSKYFSRFSFFPRYADSTGKNYFFEVTINIITFGSLLMLSIFSLFIFKGKVPKSYFVPLSLGSASWSVYFLMTASNFTGIDMEMLTVHKIADTFLWIGTTCYFYFFRKYGHLKNPEMILYSSLFLVGELIILSGPSGDAVQFGTTLPIPVTFICTISISYHAIKEALENGLSKFAILGLVSCFTFSGTGLHDLINILGITDGFMLLPIGAIAGFFFLASAVNREVEKTYSERDNLLQKLEVKVKEKTQHLTEAMESLQRSQADLVQSARLASLGTLSAGIAHEINNSINYVNGALTPLERKVMKSIPDADRAIVEKLFAAIKEGTTLTVDIVRSLRNFTGMNQAKVKDVAMSEVVESVLTILKNRLKDYKVSVDIETDLRFFTNQVGLNQILMNLISNSIDAIKPVTGEIKIKSYLSENNICLEVSDNGTGMPAEVAERIFDPFYTTKEVGKGTGLGLHIVKKEVDRQNGSISVITRPNEGTTFKILLPNVTESNLSSTEAA